MKWIALLLLAAMTFGVCFLLDKGFNKIFRSTAQHKTGLQVRLNKRYCTVGILVILLGIATLITGRLQLGLIIAALVLLALGCFLIVYYMTFGLYYDEESFLYSSFGKKSKLYSYRDITSQQLFNTAGSIVIELHFSDGRSVQLQANMEGIYPFLDKAFAGWLRQHGKRQEDCPFYDPANSCWFPPVEG